MKKADVATSSSVLLQHPILAAQYAGDSESLAKAWKSLEELEAFSGVIFEDIKDGGTEVIGAGVCVAVTDEFAQEMKTPPFFWLGPELAKRAASRRNPLLTNDELRHANSNKGVNLVAWPSSPLSKYSHRRDVGHLFMSAFMSLVRGYKCKELFFQAPLADEAMAVMQWGAALLSPDGTLSNASPQDVERVVKKPYVLVMNAEIAENRFGSWASGLFITRSPQIGFARSEQKLLMAALRGGTDEELAPELGISVSAVKKTWRSVYERVNRTEIEIFATTASVDTEEGDRGKGKKHRLLAYIQEHPEELRPVSMKLLRPAQNAGKIEHNPARRNAERRKVPPGRT